MRDARKARASPRAAGPNHDARQAGAEVLRYFDTAGRHHHEDEERDLFPLLRTEPDLAGLLAALAREHSRMEILWQGLAPLLAAPEDISDPEAFGELVAEFTRLYADHIARENGELLPRAERLLTAEQQRALGQRMAARRGLSL